MKKYLILFLFIILFSLPVFSLSYITTAESISWNGAYTSIADGFEAMLYNPAGIYMTEKRLGLNVFGTYGMRVYGNMVSTDTGLKIYQAWKKDGNFTTIISKTLAGLTDAGMDFGTDISMANFMMYVRYEKFSIGFAMIPRTYSNFSASKNFVTALSQSINLTSPLTFTYNMRFMNYLDFTYSMSTRATFLEQRIPAVEAIFVGFTGHFYMPTLYISTGTGAKISLEPGAPESTGLILNYNIYTQGEMLVGGFLPSVLKLDPTIKSYLGSIVNNDASVGFGIGGDLGFLVKVNKFLNFGFSITDIGFIVFPYGAKITVNKKTAVGAAGADVNSLIGIMSGFISGTAAPNSFAILAPMAFRTGLSFTPFQSKYFDFIAAADVSLSDIDRVLTSQYVTFNFSTGLEFAPKTGIFRMPLRIAFNYNSQANAPSFSTGIGLYLGPVEMELAVKGLEALISSLGAKEVEMGIDFKFEF